MANRYAVNLTDTSCTITINPKSRFTLIFAALVIAAFYGFAAYGIYLWFESERGGFPFRFILGIVGLVFISTPLGLFGYKVVKHSLHEEIIEVTDGNFSITDKHIFSSKPKVFDVNSIESLSVTGRDRDFTLQQGAQLTTVYQQAINDVLQNGAITLTYKGGSTHFGKKLASWDAEEIIEIIQNHPAYRQGI